MLKNKPDPSYKSVLIWPPVVTLRVFQRMQLHAGTLFFAARVIEVPGAWVFKADLRILLKGLFSILFARFSMCFFQLTSILDCFRLKCSLLAATDVVATRVTRSQNSSVFVSVTPRLAIRRLYVHSFTYFLLVRFPNLRF